MTLDVRSLRDWVADILGRGRLSGGGPLGAPRPDLDPTSPPDPDTSPTAPADDTISRDPPGRHKA